MRSQQLGLQNQITKADHLIFAVVTILYWVTLYIYVPILSPYLEAKNASYEFIGIVVGSYGLMQLLVRLPIGIWSDRLRQRKPFIVMGMLTGALSCLMFALFEPLGWTLAARAMSGISASTWVAFTVLYAGYFAKEEATKAMGTISLLVVIGQLIGMALSGFVAEGFDWKAVFWLGTIIGVLGLGISLAVKEPREGVDRPPFRKEDLREVIQNPLLWQVSTLSILGHGILFITMFGFTPSYAVTLDAGKSDLSWLSFAFMVPHAIAAYMSGRWVAPRFGYRNTLIAGFAISTVCTLAIPFTGSLGTLAFTQAINGLAQGLHLPLLLGLSIQTIEQNKRATAMGLYQAVYALGMFGGPFAAGWINGSLGLASGFYLGAAIGLCSVVLTFWWNPRQHNTL